MFDPELLEGLVEGAARLVDTVMAPRPYPEVDAARDDLRCRIQSLGG